MMSHKIVLRLLNRYWGSHIGKPTGNLYGLIWVDPQEFFYVKTLRNANLYSG